MRLAFIGALLSAFLIGVSGTLAAASAAPTLRVPVAMTDMPASNVDPALDETSVRCYSGNSLIGLKLVPLRRGKGVLSYHGPPLVVALSAATKPQLSPSAKIYCKLDFRSPFKEDYLDRAGSKLQTKSLQLGRAAMLTTSPLVAVFRK